MRTLTSSDVVTHVVHQSATAELDGNLLSEATRLVYTMQYISYGSDTARPDKRCDT